MTETATEFHFTDFSVRDWQQKNNRGTIRLAVVRDGNFACTRTLPASIGFL